MKITILGKTGCARCEACKEKMDLMNIQYEYVAMDNPIGWQGTGAVEALVSAVLADIDINKPPIIVIDGEALGYSAAMKRLKRSW